MSNNNCSINLIYDLIDKRKKMLIVGTVYYLNTTMVNLYLRLSTSIHHDLVSVEKCIMYDKRTMTRIHSKNSFNDIHFCHINNITKEMCDDRYVILCDSQYLAKDKALPFTKYFILKPLEKIPSYKRIESVLEMDLITHDTLNAKDGTNYLIIDVETNGLPTKIKYRCAKYDTKHSYDQCRMISIAWLIVDEKFNIVDEKYYMIKDTLIKNTVAAEAVNKLSDAERNRDGVKYAELISKLKYDMSVCKYIVSHGTDFDLNVLLRENCIHGLDSSFLDNTTILNTKQHLWKEDYRSPLSEIVKVDDGLSSHHPLHDCRLCLELLKKRLS